MFIVTTLAGFLVAAAAAAPSGAVASVSAVTTTAETAPFIANYVYDSAATKFYKLHRSSASWERAREICHREGAELAVPETPQQKVALEGIRIALTTDIWLGIYALVRTVREEAAIPSGYPSGFGFALRENGSTQYSDLTKEYQFVCEISEDTACGAVPGYELGPEARSCYKLHTTNKNWTEALYTCDAEDAQLTIINSQQEADHLTALIAKVTPASPSYILVGFHELFEEGKFNTLDGRSLSSSGYEKWEAGEPNQFKTERCGSITKDGKLNDIQCGHKEMFICEKKITAVIAALQECQPDVPTPDVEISK